MIITDKNHKIKHECGWIGTESDLGSDYIPGNDECDEAWSDYICPGCGYWEIDLDDYEIIDDEAPSD